ncbi:hypothetical protein TG4357_03443 [Thalassovita gelatinovora]|uniref:Asp/Glu/Hydantoin racemase n=1 Tax=Thalassovita gelatinovora TaxID=53501 RepID=A0A0P1G5A9_THAGE|nr:hypothetical protein [Thalassovita gelatinovora]QIZ81675.1 hypothetical protein HFZ77_14900 [Thalassovita gelatinovora]CUH68197.1 hypothetical protein TG4357_03443 [Thalassovita gelatinovora]SEQ30991.1 hypothetical protein SAMN04488043_104314 [Thalassovita gelatinovora]
MILALIHTADIHRTTFDRLRDRIAPQLGLHHIIREDWLARARQRIDGALTREITETIAMTDGPVLCSCTTLGPIAEAAGALRVDQPMMRQAAQSGGKLLIAYCLKSTEASSLLLLRREMARAGNDCGVEPLYLGSLWPLFEAGETESFAKATAAALRASVGKRCDLAAVVLAQASMAQAADYLVDLPIPVLASPETAFRAALERIGQA